MPRFRLSMGLYAIHVAGTMAGGDLHLTSSAAELGSYILHGIGASSTESSHGQTRPSNTLVSNSSASSSTNTPTAPASVTSKLTTDYPFSNAKISSVSPVLWSTGIPQPYFEHATSCWTEFIDWYHSWPGYIRSHGIPTRASSFLQTFPGEVTSTALTLYPTADVGTYKLCDGFIRANYTPTTIYTTFTSTPDVETAFSTISPRIPPKPCQPTEQDCEIWWFLSNIGDDQASPDVDALAGQCGFPLDPHAKCVIQGGSVRLLYFPVETEGDLCASNRTVKKSPDARGVVTALGTTFDSGSVYLSFDTLFAAYETIASNGRGLPVGPTLYNAILAFKSDEISTNCYHGTHKGITTSHPGTPLNYADLNYPVPASAYQCQNKCSSEFYLPDGSRTSRNPDPCTTIWDDFGPILAMPTRVSEMFSEWSTCKYWNFYQRDILFDPPSALQQATAIPSPTLPTAGLGLTTAPSPASTPSPVPGPTTHSVLESTAPIAESSALNQQTTEPVPEPTTPVIDSSVPGGHTTQLTPEPIMPVADSSVPNQLTTQSIPEPATTVIDSSATSRNTIPATPATPATLSSPNSESSNVPQNEATEISGSADPSAPAFKSDPTQSNILSITFSFDPAGATESASIDSGNISSNNDVGSTTGTSNGLITATAIPGSDATIVETESSSVDSTDVTVAEAETATAVKDRISTTAVESEGQATVVTDHSSATAVESEAQATTESAERSTTTPDLTPESATTASKSVHSASTTATGQGISSITPSTGSASSNAKLQSCALWIVGAGMMILTLMT